MGLIDTIRKRITGSKPAEKSIEIDRFLDWLGVDRSTSESELSAATYLACIRLLSESVGKLPLKLMQYNDRNGILTRRDDPRYYILGTRPNPYQTATTFWSTVEMNRSHYGNAFVLIADAGSKMTLWLLPTERVQVVNDDKDLFRRGEGKLYYVYTGNNGIYTFADEEILHFKSSVTLDGILGISIRDLLRNVVGSEIDAQKMLSGMYKNGYTGKAVLQYTGDLNDDLVKRYIQGIEEYASGKRRGADPSTIIPIPVGSTLTPLNVKLTDGQFLEIKQYTALQIAAAFGIKPNQINDLTKSSYASGEQQQLAFYVDTMLYILKQYEEELTFKLLSKAEAIESGMFFKFNIDVVLRADFATKIDSLGKAVNTFLMTPNEARERLDLGNVARGDKLIGQGANLFLDQLGAQYNTAQSEQEGGETNV